MRLAVPFQKALRIGVISTCGAPFADEAIMCYRLVTSTVNAKITPRSSLGVVVLAEHAIIAAFGLARRFAVIRLGALYGAPARQCGIHTVPLGSTERSALMLAKRQSAGKWTSHARFLRDLSPFMTNQFPRPPIRASGSFCAPVAA